jgi:RNA polymerase sigma-70 factor (ECF subfamily)
MSDTTRAQLMRSLLTRYDVLKDRLAQRLRSHDLASDALQETWLRLARRDDLEEIKNPEAYVYRAALNTAANLRKANSRRLTSLEVVDILGIADEAPGPAQIAADRADVALVVQALADLPDRQRAVFYESFLGEATHHELAQQFGVTVRTIQTDLQKAVEHCARRLGKRKSFASGVRRLSRDRG